MSIYLYLCVCILLSLFIYSKRSKRQNTGYSLANNASVRTFAHKYACTYLNITYFIFIYAHVYRKHVVLHLDDRF